MLECSIQTRLESSNFVRAECIRRTRRRYDEPRYASVNAPRRRLLKVRSIVAHVISTATVGKFARTLSHRFESDFRSLSGYGPSQVITDRAIDH
jgi:hypothetical protein